MAIIEPDRLIEAADAILNHWGDGCRTVQEWRLILLRFTEEDLTEALAFLHRAGLLPNKPRATKQ